MTDVRDSSGRIFSPQQFNILRTLKRVGPCTMSRLVQVHTASRRPWYKQALDSLLTGQYVGYRYSSRGYKRVVLTDRGETLLSELSANDDALRTH